MSCRLQSLPARKIFRSGRMRMRTKQWSPHIDWRAARLGVTHTISRNSSGLYKIEQPVRLCACRVPSGTPRSAPHRAYSHENHLCRHRVFAPLRRSCFGAIASGARNRQDNRPGPRILLCEPGGESIRPHWAKRWRCQHYDWLFPPGMESRFWLRAEFQRRRHANSQYRSELPCWSSISRDLPSSF